MKKFKVFVLILLSLLLVVPSTSLALTNIEGIPGSNTSSVVAGIPFTFTGTNVEGMEGSNAYTVVQGIGSAATYTLTTSVSPAICGTVTKVPPGPNYAPLTNVDCTANAVTGCVFDHWSGDAVGGSNPVTVIMTANKAVTANFNVTGGNDSYTVSLLHMDGTGGSNVFTDSAYGGTHTWTPNNTAQLDTSTKVFGTASGQFLGGADFIGSASSTDWDFGSGDFTIDLRVRFNTLPSVASYQMICSRFGDLTHLWYFALKNDAGNYTWNFYDTGTGSNVNVVTTLSATTWYHIALVRTGNVIRIFQGGNQVGADGAMVGSIYAGAVTLFVGKWDYSVEHYNINGWVDESRISKGIARWTTNFTIPIAAYSP